MVGNDPFCFDLCSQDTCIYTSLFDECESISKICLINCDDRLTVDEDSSEFIFLSTTIIHADVQFLL